MRTLLVLALFTLAGCSNDDTAQESNREQKGTSTGVTEFAVKEATTRTMGVYSGLGIDFYRAQGDKLWINNTSPLIQNSDDDVTGKAATAKFYFIGTYNTSSYPVRYTGKGSNADDKVVIEAGQRRTTPNDGSHIRTNDDCGTAVATRGADGKHGFTLSYKTSYTTLMSYYSYKLAEDVRVTRTKVTADEIPVGEFKPNDSGLNPAPHVTVVNPGKNITPGLNGGTNGGFTIPIGSNYTKNVAIVVFAPDTYHNFIVECRPYDRKTLVYGTVSKGYGQLTFHAGRNKRVVVDLQIPNYSKDRLCTWDAAVGQNAWKSYGNYQPIPNEDVDSHCPTVGTDTRWYNPALIPVKASRSAGDCLNANEISQHCIHGDPHWDSSIWSAMKHLYGGGMWLKRRNVIAADQHKVLQQLKDAIPGGIDYVKAYPLSFKIYDLYVKNNMSVILDKPTNSSDYMFLPTTGSYHAGDGELQHVGNRGYYQSSTPRQDGDLNAYNLYVQGGRVHVGYGDRINVRCLWPE